MKPIDPESLTTRQVSAITGFADVTHEIWRTQGKGPRFYRVGRAVRYRRKDVEAWIEAHMHDASAAQGASR